MGGRRAVGGPGPAPHLASGLASFLSGVSSLQLSTEWVAAAALECQCMNHWGGFPKMHIPGPSPWRPSPPAWACGDLAFPAAPRGASCSGPTVTDLAAHDRATHQGLLQVQLAPASDPTAFPKSPSCLMGAAAGVGAPRSQAAMSTRPRREVSLTAPSSASSPSARWRTSRRGSLRPWALPRQK